MATRRAGDSPRSDALRVFFKGPGVMSSRNAARRREDGERSWANLVTTGVPIPLFDLLDSALDAMPPSKAKDAVANALGAGGDGGSDLARRREAYAQRHHMDVRTLYRHEAAGIDELLRSIDVVLDRQRAEDDDLDRLLPYLADLPSDPEELRRYAAELAAENAKLRGSAPEA